MNDHADSFRDDVVNMSIPPAIVGFLDQDYPYKSVASWYRPHTLTNNFSSTGEDTEIQYHSASYKMTQNQNIKIYIMYMSPKKGQVFAFHEMITQSLTDCATRTTINTRGLWSVYLYKQQECTIKQVEFCTELFFILLQLTFNSHLSMYKD